MRGLSAFLGVDFPLSELLGQAAVVCGMCFRLFLCAAGLAFASTKVGKSPFHEQERLLAWL